ncbi:MAG: RDD family protein [Bacilli bacterium]|jgi:hypothetical protein|nr:RDD family protein [Bacilli bacterium]
MPEAPVNTDIIEVNYAKAKYSRRILAFLFDMLCVGILSSLLLLATRAISERQPAYLSALQMRESLQEASYLYVKNTDEKYDLITDFYADNTDYIEVNGEYESALVAFYSSPNFFDQSDSSGGIALYNNQKIGETAIPGDYFVYSGSEPQSIIPNPEYDATKMNKFYLIAIEEVAYSYLNSNPDYYAASRTILMFSNFFILPVSIVVSLLIFEMAVPLLFSRGKQTFGRKIFHIGLVTNKAVSPSAGRFLAKFSLFLFVEIIVSLFTFGVPVLFSVSMFFFTKNNQSFSDYMLGIFSVDIETKMIYKSLEEYEDRHANASFNL